MSKKEIINKLWELNSELEAMSGEELKKSSTDGNAYSSSFHAGAVYGVNMSNAKLCAIIKEVIENEG